MVETQYVTREKIALCAWSMRLFRRLEQEWQWHYDFATHHNEDGVPEPLALNLHVFLDDVNEHNGPLMFIPGSHKRPVRTALDTTTTNYALWIVDNETVAWLVAERGDCSRRPGQRGPD